MGLPITHEAGDGGRLPRSLSPVARWVSLAETVCSRTAGLLLLVAALAVTASVSGRIFVNAAIPDDVILVGLMMIGIVALPLAEVQATRGHIAVTVVTDLLPPIVTVACRLFGNILALTFFPLLGWLVAVKVPEAFDLGYYYDGTLRIPVWPGQVVFATGIGLFTVRLVLSVIADANALLFGRR